ncbi:LADA_0H05688g1_1 [Lachancea dasiensis]|uniref:LADA_0H05688g1_1 n=1 Tax=Lachancea dasiensis TaxID=1072105 RepID=A0A1G4K1H2_9SACH|nr:LADA_0H05688g1_1 [Lachancea dasiensis]
MDSRSYLKSYGWVEGEALRAGGLKRPILVKHKADKKGLGSAPGGDDGDMWWETLFDGHLKNLEIGKASDGNINFKKNIANSTTVIKDKSPLYNMFVKGEVLKGTIDTNGKSSEVRTVRTTDGSKRRRDSEEESSLITSKKRHLSDEVPKGKEKTVKKVKKDKKDKNDKKDKKVKKVQKVKKDKKEKKEKKAKKEKKDKKDKKAKKDKKEKRDKKDNGKLNS